MKRTPLARVLQRLFAGRKTGSLLLMRENIKKIVSFVDGYPVSVRSNVLGECLGQILLQQRLISPEALQDSLRRMKAEKRHQGEILVEMGVLSPYNLSRALVEQLEAKLFEIFAWADGQYMFKEGDAPHGEALRLERSPAALILEGIRRHYDLARQQSVLAAYAGKYLSPSGDPVLRLQEVTSDPTEQQFIRDLDGRTRLETVIASARIPPDNARLLLVALSQAGMLEAADAPSPRPPTPAPITSVDVPAVPAAVPDTVAPLSVTQLGLVAQTVRSQNHYWALGVRADDSTETIDRAYEIAGAQFSPRSVPPASRRRSASGAGDLRTPGRGAPGTARSAATARLHRAPGEAAIERLRLRSRPRGAAAAGGGQGAVRRGHAAPAGEPPPGGGGIVSPGGADVARSGGLPGGPGLVPVPGGARGRAGGRAALAELRRAIQLDPKSRRARYYLGYFYAQSGQPDLAVTEFEKLLELDPGATDVADELRRLRQSI